MKRREGIGAGSASLLVVFVLLCLTTFAVLSLASAQADRRLADRTARSMEAYYVADALATERLAALRHALQTVDSSLEPEPYWSRCAAVADGLFEGLTVAREENGLGLRYQVPIDERRALAVDAVAKTNTETGELGLSVSAWKSIQTGEWVEQETITLWPGTGTLFGEGTGA
ncbi:MAG: hypothetical protein RRY21_04040 [Oscillospiraceae bacterium]